MCMMCLYNRVEVPNDEIIAQVFQDALRGNQACSEHWAVTSSVDSISMHVSCEMVLSNTHAQLLFLQGKLCTAKTQHVSRESFGNDWSRSMWYMAKICFISLIGFIHFVFNGFSIGVTLDEMCVISTAHSNVVPVRSGDGRMRLLDFPAPFLFSRDRRYYGSGLQCGLNWGSSLAY